MCNWDKVYSCWEWSDCCILVLHVKLTLHKACKFKQQFSDVQNKQWQQELSKTSFWKDLPCSGSLEHLTHMRAKGFVFGFLPLGQGSVIPCTCVQLSLMSHKSCWNIFKFGLSQWTWFQLGAWSKHFLILMHKVLCSCNSCLPARPWEGRAR